MTTSCVLVAQLCPALCHSMACSPPGFSVHGILQARMEWVAIPFSRGSSQTRDQTHVSCIAGRQILYHMNHQESHHKRCQFDFGCQSISLWNQRICFSLLFMVLRPIGCINHILKSFYSIIKPMADISFDLHFLYLLSSLLPLPYNQ